MHLVNGSTGRPGAGSFWCGDEPVTTVSKPFGRGAGVPPKRWGRDTGVAVMASCSPVCAEKLDVVVVLGMASKPLDEAGVERTRSVSSALLEHFELGRVDGSLFGFADASGGARGLRVVAGLDSDRRSLRTALSAWRPGPIAIGHEGPEALAVNPELLGMIKASPRESRGDVRRVLLVLGAEKEPSLLAIPARNIPIAHPDDGGFDLALAAATGSPTKVGGNSSGWKFNWEVMEALLQTCPAVRLDPSLECGRMRWGSGESGSIPSDA